MKTFNQTDVFIETEADEWYLRNANNMEKIGLKKNILPVEINEIYSLLNPFKKNITKILEIGSSSGQKIELLGRKFNADSIGVEPSKLAVKEGNKRLKGSKTKLICGVADCLPFDREYFDLVCFGFCLYLIDRSKILLSLSEADRVLKPGGFLAITDFDPSSPHRNPYSHKKDIYSYKQDYSRIYTDSGLYHLVGKKSFSHKNNYFDIDSNERISVSLLYKTSDK